MAGRPVRFGVVFDFRRVPPDTRTFPEIYAEILELITLADRLGIDYVYLSEHHLVEDGHSHSLMSIAAAIAARTERIRISTYVFLLPLHHPLRVAEDVATIDIAPPPYVSGEQAVYEAYRDEFRRAGGHPDQSGVAGSFNVVVTDDPDSYRARAGPGAAHRAHLYERWYGTSPDIDDDVTRIATRPARRTGVIGDAPACIAALEEFLAGPIPYTHVIMAVEGPAELDVFASQVIPRYRTVS